MKYFKLHSLILLALTVNTLSAQQKMVNIVFTDAEKVRSIDTVISTDDELSTVYADHGLTSDRVHEIHLDDIGMSWVSKEGPVQKVMIIETEDEHNDSQGKEIQKEVRVVHIESDGEELSEEELQALTQKMMDKHGIVSEGSENKTMVKKRVIVEKHDEGQDAEELKIEVKIEDGKETVVAHRNGVRLTDEEAQSILAEQKHEMHEGTQTNQVHVVHKGQVEIEENHFVSKSDEDIEAIVIIKSLPAKANAASSSVNQLEPTVFPNPASEQIKVQMNEISGPYTIRITNMLGELVLEEKGAAQGAIDQNINARTLDSGTYILSIDHAGGLHSEKIVIE